MYLRLYQSTNVDLLKHLAPDIVFNVLYIDFIIWFICILLY